MLYKIFSFLLCLTYATKRNFFPSETELEIFLEMTRICETEVQRGFRIVAVLRSFPKEKVQCPEGLAKSQEVTRWRDGARCFSFCFDIIPALSKTWRGVYL